MSSSSEVKAARFALRSGREQEILLKINASGLRSEAEFKKVVASLEAQNTRLREELQSMNSKVAKLVEKKKLSAPQFQNQHIETQIIAKKTELEAKYRELHSTKKELHNLQSQRLDPNLKDKLIKYEDEVKDLDRQIKGLQLQKRFLQISLNTHQKALAQYNAINGTQQLPTGYFDKAKLEELLAQNKELKKRANTQRKQDASRNNQDIKYQQSFVSLVAASRGRSRISTSNLSNRPTLQAIKGSEIPKKSEILLTEKQALLEKEVEELKDKKNSLQLKEEKKKNQLQARRENLYKSNQELIDKHKRLEIERNKLFQENNKYEALLTSLDGLKRKHETVKTYSQSSTQTESIHDLLILRRDYAGTLGRIRFDDRLSVLMGNFNTKVHRVIVYEHDKGICCVKFNYFTDNSNSIPGTEEEQTIMETMLPVPSAYLQKCRKRNLQVPRPNFFKLFKVKWSGTERRITKIEIVSNFNEKMEFGDKKGFEVMGKDDSVYGFDIKATQHPAAMFGSVMQVGNEWYLQGLGAEIKDAAEPA